MSYEIFLPLPALTENSKRPPGPKLRLNNNIYTQKRHVESYTDWRCARRPCGGTAKSGPAPAYRNPVEGNPHTTHPAEINLI